MSTDLLLQGDEAAALAHELAALTGDTPARVLAAALREHLVRTQEARRFRAWNDRAEVLGRALAASRGPGIPVNHCWGASDPSPE